MSSARKVPVLTAFVVLFVVVDLVLLAFAIRLGASEVRDGAGRVTTGTNVALSIAGTLLAAAALRRARVSWRLRRSLQLFALVSIAAHAWGHLARWYYDFWWYDEVLHMIIPGVAGVLAVRYAQESGLFPSRHATPRRAALLALIATVAIAGVWEIFEFSMDRVQSSREQDDLADTMTDMIDGLVGAFFAAAWCWRFPRGWWGRDAASDRQRAPAQR